MRENVGTPTARRGHGREPAKTSGICPILPVFAGTDGFSLRIFVPVHAMLTLDGMHYQFTPAAERAMAVAADWASCVESDALHVPEVLLGLLADPECRSALLLAPYGVDAVAVGRRFSSLRLLEPADPGRARQFSADWLDCLRAAEALLVDYAHPMTLATEHLLLGIAAADNEVSRWLREQGLDAAALEAEVHRLAGHCPGPLPFEAEDEEQDTLVWPTTPGERPDRDEDEASIHARPLESSGVQPHERIAALRVIDAAANRAGEGLRVIEDYLRFALDDRHLTTLCKAIRHELTAVLEVFVSTERHAARETREDVGTSLSTDAEQSRSGAGSDGGQL